MPLFKKKKYNTTKIWIWKISESLEELKSKAILNQAEKNKFEKITREEQKKTFLNIRIMLHLIGINSDELCYNDNGKPYLKNKKISISHSFEFVCIAIDSSNNEIGVDIEKVRTKTLNVYDKFINTEKSFVNKKLSNLKKITTIWSAKEAVYKTLNTKGLPLKEIQILPFTDIKKQSLANVLSINKKCKLHFYYFEDFVMALSIEIATKNQLQNHTRSFY